MGGWMGGWMYDVCTLQPTRRYLLPGTKAEQSA